jgi:hypothetical protein
MEEPNNVEVLPHNQHEITFRGLAGATIDTVKLYRSGDVNPLGALAIVGMKAAFPERFSNAQLRNDSNLDFFNGVIWLGVEVNDAVDIIPQARTDQKQVVIENIFGSWKKVIRVSRGVAGESEEKNQLLTNYQREILFLEKRARETGDTQSLEDVRTYRQVMNAISIVHNAGALFGSETLSPRLDTIDKANLSWDTLKNKYDWVINGKPQNDTERRLCALYNLVMGVQVIDDYCDLADDKRLGLHTIATRLLKDVPDSVEAERIIKADAENYFSKAEELGVSQPAWKGIRFIFTKLKGLQSRFPDKAGGRRERLLNGGKKIIQEVQPEA